MTNSLANDALVATVALALLSASAGTLANDMRPLFENGAFAESYQRVQQLEHEALRDQTFAAYYTFVGRQDLQAKLEGNLPLASTRCLADTDESVIAVNAHDWVLQQAANHQLVMFNENHYRIEARLFVLNLLDDLKTQGFTHIGFEAFAETPSSENGTSPKLLPEHGFYTHEPVFSALVQRAYELDFEVFGYESTEPVPEGASPIEVREEAQANNILSKLEAPNEDAKFIIFAGWAHITEGPYGVDENQWMAARLKEKAGLDPFTVDLTSCAEPATTALQNSVYLQGGESIVTGSYQGVVDAQVSLAVPGENVEQAGFYRQHLGQGFDVPKQLYSHDQPLLLRAYAQSAETMVAADQVLINPDDDSGLKLYLATGERYLLRAYSGTGEILYESEVIQ